MGTALEWLLAMNQGGQPRFEAAVQAMSAGEAPSVVAAVLWAAGAVDAPLASSQALRRSTLAWRQKSGVAPEGFREVAIELIANETLSFLADGLFACGLRHGLLISPIWRRFDETVAEVRQSGLGGTPLDLAMILAPGELLGEPGGAPRALDDVGMLAQAFASARSARVVVATLPARIGEPKNSSDLVIADSPRAQRARLNAGLVDLCRAGRAIAWDMEALAGRVGASDWFDPRLQLHAKIPFSLAATMRVADDLAAVIAGAMGHNRRLLVLDLDNTLWGGVIGDDGSSGIVLGQGSAAGEAYLEVQRAALELRRRGVALAVCSKNEEGNAREPFRRHPDMLLKEEHFAAFVANWQDKATNIRAIAEELSLGLQSIAFLDDNPAERERVRQVLPEVAVIETGEDPARYASRLLQSGYFEHLPLTAEDRARAADYQANTERSAMLTRAGSYEDYLTSLAMELSIAPFDALGRARISQLVNRSNQFNLTTRRYNDQDVERIERSDRHIGWQVRLKDRFADNGMISVIVVERQGASWLIDSWLMSCRVLQRGVEGAVLNSLVERARAEGAQWLIGDYLPTPKNGLVAGHYQSLGFEPMEAIAGPPGTGDGRRATRWRLPVEGYEPKPVRMTIRFDNPATGGRPQSA